MKYPIREWVREQKKKNDRFINFTIIIALILIAIAFII